MAIRSGYGSPRLQINAQQGLSPVYRSNAWLRIESTGVQGSLASI